MSSTLLAARATLLLVVVDVDVDDDGGFVLGVLQTKTRCSDLYL